MTEPPGFCGVCGWPLAAASGGPLLDVEGRVLGVNSWVYAQRESLSFAVPVDAFRADLERHAGTSASVLGLKPVYRCVECRTAYEPRDAGDGRCLACGAPLPYANELGGLSEAHAFFQAERIVHEMIERLGFAPHQVRIAQGVWRLSREALEVWIYLDRSGEYVVFQSRLCQLPRTGQEALFRFLLTVNDKTSGPCRIALKKDVVLLSFAEPTDFLNQSELTASLGLLLAMSAELRGVLQATYGALPAPDGMEEAEEPL